MVMVNTKRCIFCVGLIASGTWAFITGAFSGKKYATLGLILYTATGATGIIAELTRNMSAMQVDTYTFETTYIIGIDLLAVDLIGAAGYDTKKGRYILAFPLLDLIARFFFDEEWEPITFVTHLLPVSLFIIFSYQKENLMLLLAGLSFLFAHYINRGDFDDIIAFDANGVFFTGMFFLGKDFDSLIR